MNVQILKISDLKAPETNVRRHGEKQLVEYKRSVEMFGQIRPIVVDENYTILAGNGLYRTLVEMGRDTAECYVVRNLTEKEKKKLMLADNKVFSLGQDDFDAFEKILGELNGDIDIPGFDEDLLKTITASVTETTTMVQSYGTFSDEDINKNINNSASKDIINMTESAASSTAQTPTAQQYTNTMAVTQTATEPQQVAIQPQSNTQALPKDNVLQGKCLVCPHCGEKIWL